LNAPSVKLVLTDGFPFFENCGGVAMLVRPYDEGFVFKSSIQIERLIGIVHTEVKHPFHKRPIPLFSFAGISIGISKISPFFMVSN
jgi:hypothetical protein